MSKYTLIFLAFFLSGCVSMNSKFDCPNKPGVTCKSLDQVNTMVNRGEIGRDDTRTFAVVDTEAISADLNVKTERITPIWVAPYQDQNGNMHSQSMLYTRVGDK